MSSFQFGGLRTSLEICLPLLFGLVLPLLAMVVMRKKTRIAVNNLRFAPWTMAALWFYAIFFRPPNGWVYRPWQMLRPYSLLYLEKNLDLVAVLLVPGILFVAAGFVLHRKFKDKASGETFGSISFAMFSLAGLILMFIPSEWMDWGAHVRLESYGMEEFLRYCLVPALGFAGAAMIPMIGGIAGMAASVFHKPKTATEPLVTAGIGDEA